MNARRPVVSLLALAMAGTVGEVQAQTTISLGILGGATSAKISGPDAPPDLTRSRVGFAAGGALTIGVSPYIAIEPEVLFVQKGAKEKSGGTGSVKLSYVEVPFLAKVRTLPKGGERVSTHLYVGPAIAFKVGCKAKFTESNGALHSGTCGEGDFQEIKVKSTDFSLVFGVGLDIGRVMIGARYDLGLTQLGNSGTNDNFKSRTFYLLGGVSFKTLH